MKRAFSKNSDVVNLWVAQSQHEAWTGQVTMRGGVLMSYRTIIAAVVDGADGTPIRLIESTRYSDSTTVIQNLAADGARRAGIQAFRVRGIEQTPVAHLHAYENDIAAKLAKVENARLPHFWRSGAVKTIAEATAYAKARGVSWTYDGPAPASVLSRLERRARA